jgi:hypothetical protein
MSDTADDDGFYRRQVLNKSKTEPLREQMREFVAEHDDTDLKELRSRVSAGEDLSEIVQTDREDRV